MAAADLSPGFASLAGEATLASLPVAGRFPDWLRGTLVCDGPGLFEVGGRPLGHWFDGFAALQGFRFTADGVAYRSRFLRSRSYLAAIARGRLAQREFGSDPRRPWWRRLWTLVRPAFTDNCLVNVARIGDRHVALTETPRPLVFDPRTLDTLGPFRWGDGWDDDPSTAHPVVDPQDGATWWLGRRLGKTSLYAIHRQERGAATRRAVVRHPVTEVSYQHSMAITRRWLVIAEFPHLARPLSLALASTTIADTFRWRPERGTRFLVFDQRDGSLRATIMAPAMFAFHLANAWDEDDAIVLDLAAFDAATVIADYRLERLRDPAAVPPLPRFRRWRLRLGGAAERIDVPEFPFEFPRCAPDAVGGRHRWLYGIGADPGPAPGWFDRVVKVDGATARIAATWQRPGCHPGEPILVQPAGARDEDDGILLSQALDATSRRSFLVALDARDLTEVARAELPHAAPFGFHGAFFAD